MPGQSGPADPGSGPGSPLTGEQILAAVIASPDDDGPRLAYADWLDAHGQPDQARFIRLACELARAGDARPDVPELTREADALHAAHREAWSSAIMPGAHDVLFHRGFAYCASLMLPVALPGEPGYLPDLLYAMDRAPLTQLRPDLFEPQGPDWETEARDPGECEFADRAHRLAAARRLAADPRVARLTALILDQQSWGEEAFRALLQGAHWHGLDTLVIHDGDCHLYAAEAIAAGPALKQLSVLVFEGDSDADLGDAGAAVLAATPQLATLRSLSLLTVDLGPAGAGALAASPHLTGLEELDLGGGSYNVNHIGPEGAEAIADAAFGSLSRLNLDCNQIGNRGLHALANSRSLNAVSSLSLTVNDIGDAGLRSLAEGRGMPQLATLVLSSNTAITGEGVAALAAAERFRTLETLWLPGCRIGPQGAAAIAQSPHSAGLRNLGLLGHGIGPEGAKALAGSPYLDGLTRLRLGDSTIDDESRGLLRARFGARLELGRRNGPVP
jgi:uncharacterized protein (TIGR02996 family)